MKPRVNRVNLSRKIESVAVEKPRDEITATVN